MNDPDQDRKAELLKIILENKILNITSGDIEDLIKLENDMVVSKNMLVELNEKGIIGEADIERKVAKCFDVFLMHVSNKYGKPFCQKVYDYLPGEEIGFLKGYESNPLVSKATEIRDISTILKNTWEKLIENHSLERRVAYPLLNMIDRVAITSNELALGMDEKFKSISKIGKVLYSDIENVLIIEDVLMPHISPAEKYSVYKFKISPKVGPAPRRGRRIRNQGSKLGALKRERVEKLKNDFCYFSYEINTLSEVSGWDRPRFDKPVDRPRIHIRKLKGVGSK